MINPCFDILNVKEEAMNFTKGDVELRQAIESSFAKPNKPLRRRLFRWIKFFNDNRADFLCTYSILINEVIEFSKHNELFKSQTQHEFETSIRFFEIIKAENLNLYFEEKEAVHYLINLSLIIGKYPGMVIVSLRNELIQLLQKPINSVSLKDFLVNIFVKYEKPCFLINNFNALTLIELEALMHILQGHNLRSFNKLPIKISKKESFIILNKLPKHWKVKNNVLLYSIIHSKLANTKFYKDDILYKFINLSRAYKNDLEGFIKNLDYWKQVLELLYQVDWSSTDLEIREFTDYFEYLILKQKNVSLKHRTPNSIENAIIKWHHKIKNEDYEKSLNVSWRGQNEIMQLIELEGRSYRFKEMTNGKDLYLESKTLNHCVFSYVNWCKLGSWFHLQYARNN